MKKLLTRKELCELLCISDSTRYRMTKTGEFILPVNGQGRKLLFDPDAVEAWIKSRQQPVAQSATTNPTKTEKQKSRDFAERQLRAQQALERHVANRKGGTK